MDRRAPLSAADRRNVLRALNEALAVEIVCARRHKRHCFMAKAIGARDAMLAFGARAATAQARAEALAERIASLGGAPGHSLAGLVLLSRDEYEAGGDLARMAAEDRAAERVVLETYAELILQVGEADPDSRALLERIREDEERRARRAALSA